MRLHGQIGYKPSESVVETRKELSLVTSRLCWGIEVESVAFVYCICQVCQAECGNPNNRYVLKEKAIPQIK